jgi:hypothetical protein
MPGQTPFADTPVSALRKVWAFFAFNFYFLAFLWAFQVNTPYVFDGEIVRRLEGGDFDAPSQWGWGNHYVWRLTGVVVATFLAGILAGAIARTRAGVTAAMSNLPSMAIAAYLTYYLAFEHPTIAYGDEKLVAHTGMIVTSLISIPLSAYLAFMAGNYGVEVQEREFGGKAVLGISGYHWLWLIGPTYLYTLVCICPLANLLRFDFLHSDGGFLSCVVSLVLLVTVIASAVPLVWVYKRLLVPAASAVASIRRGIENAVILGVGLMVVAVVQLVSFRLLGKLALLPHGLQAFLSLF